MKNNILMWSRYSAKWTKKLLCVLIAVSTLTFLGSTAYAEGISTSNNNVAAPTTSADTVDMITPKPYSVQKITDEPFTFTQGMCVALSSDSLKPAIDILNNRLTQAYGVTLKTAKTATCPISYTLVDNIAMPNSSAVTNTSFQNNEAYSVKITHTSIVVKSTGIRGAIWASQTLTQLLGPWAFSQVRLAQVPKVPAVNITDAPRYAYRGFMLDPVRSFYPTNEVKRIIDIMSYMKMNVLHLHLADNQGWRIAIDNDGKVAGDTIDYNRLTDISGKTAFNEGWSRFNPDAGRSGFYTKAQFIDLVKYAALHGIGVLAEIDGPGHSAAMLHAIPQLNTADSTPKPENGQDTAELTKANWGKFALATKAQVTYTFMEHVMKEIEADIAQGITESKVPEVAQNYFHLGGDEVNLPADTPNRAETTQIAMQTYLGKVAKLTTDMNKTPIVWNDGLAAADSLPDGTVIQVWAGRPDGNGGALQKFVKAHHGKVIMSTTKTSYLVQKGSPEVVAPDYACRKVGCTTRDYYNWDPTANAKVQESDMLGTESAVWTEHLRSLHDTEFMMYPRFFANAEVAWTQNSIKNYDDWAKRIGNLAAALINNGNTFQLTTSAEIPNWHGEYRAVYVDNVLKPGQTIQIGALAQPGMTSVDGVHAHAQFTDSKTGQVTPLEIHVVMDQVFNYQNPTESKDRYMNSIAKLMVTIPESLAGSMGTLTVTGHSDDSNRGTIALVAGTQLQSMSSFQVLGKEQLQPMQPKLTKSAESKSGTSTMQTMKHQKTMQSMSKLSVSAHHTSNMMLAQTGSNILPVLVCVVSAWLLAMVLIIGKKRA